MAKIYPHINAFAYTADIRQTCRTDRQNTRPTFWYQKAQNGYHITFLILPIYATLKRVNYCNTVKLKL